MDWLDRAKGLAIVLVVWGHNAQLSVSWPTVHLLVFAVHVPLFFALSGATLQQGVPLRSVLERSLALLWVYAVAALLFLPPALWGRDGASSLADALAGIVYASGHTIRAVPTWFLPCLALALPVAALGLWCSGRLPPRHRVRAVAALGVLLLLGGAALLQARSGTLQAQLAWGSPEYSGWPWSADLVPLGAGYLLLGGLLAGHLTRHPGRRVQGAGLVLGALFLAVCIALQPQVDLHWRLLEPPALALVTSLLGIGAVCLLAHRPGAAHRLDLASTLGRATLPILILHNPLQRAAGEALVRLGLPGWVAGVCALVIGVALPLWLDRALLSRTGWGRFLFYPRQWLRQRAGTSATA
jgi:fucose 4-O-acetylase-like acetyltransferase